MLKKKDISIPTTFSMWMLIQHKKRVSGTQKNLLSFLYSESQALLEGSSCNRDGEVVFYSVKIKSKALEQLVCRYPNATDVQEK